MADKKDKKKKGAKKGATGDAQVASVATHPAAGIAVRRMRGWAALLAFAFVAFMSWRAGVPPFAVAVRGLIAGIVANLAAWAAGLAFWRQLVVAELRAEAERIRAEREARQAELLAAQDAA